MNAWMAMVDAIMNAGMKMVHFYVAAIKAICCRVTTNLVMI
jgi:hypothetical protein